MSCVPTIGSPVRQFLEPSPRFLGLAEYPPQDWLYTRRVLHLKVRESKRMVGAWPVSTVPHWVHPMKKAASLVLIRSRCALVH